MPRINMKDLQNLVDRINRLMETPMEPYIDGKPQAGSYFIESSFGGVGLYRMDVTLSGTGTETIINVCPKGVLYKNIYSYIKGILAMRDKK